MTKQPEYYVRAVHCDHRSSDEEVYKALKRATDPLHKAWAKLESASRIGIKFNQAWAPNRLVTLEGQLQELVDYSVARATLRLLRERTTADLICTEISTGARHKEYTPMEHMTLLPIIQEFGVEMVDGDLPPHKTYQVPGGGHMFRQYLLPESVMETDAFVSVQPFKSHKFMGVTMTLKNLFGLTPMEPHGRSRSYFHHIMRLSNILVDLGELINPTLNIVDGLAAQSGAEWGGEGRLTDMLMAGDHTIATDAVGTYLMGFHPMADWPDQPFIRDRSSLLIAHNAGFGSADLREIDWQSDVAPFAGQFRTEVTDDFETVLAWRRSTCEQALYYRDHMGQLVDRYAGEYILLQDNEVRWHNTSSDLTISRRELAGPNKQSAMYLKLVDPDEAEGEHFEVYERELDTLRQAGH